METKKKYLLFRIKDATYAVLASEVREIVTGLPQFSVPFVPRWVRGVLNRHGEPYIVLDVQCLLGGEALEGETSVLLNRDDDQVAILTAGVVEFLEVADGDVHQIASPDGEAAFFSGSLGAGSGEVFILDVSRILRKLDDDVGAT